MRKHVEYKDSNELWYKEIPNNWNILRLKDITRNLTSGATPSSGNATYYNDGTINWLNTGDLNDGIIINTVKKLNKDVFKDYPNLKIQKKGTLVIAMYGATIGKLGLLDIDATTNQACCCLNLYKSFNSKYYFYLLLSNKQNIISLSVGGTQPNVSQSILANIKLIAPPLSEQQTIANYLDAKTQAIDKKVSLLEQKIETYKKLKRTLINQTITKGLNKNVPLKDSGISWIGQIPQHWEVKRFKDVLYLFTGNSISDKNGFDYIENSIPYVSTKDIDFNTNEINYENGMYIPKSDKVFKRAKKGTCLICIEGANAGKKYGILNQEVAFVNKLAALKFIANRNFDKYLYYYIQSIAFSGEFFPLINGLIGGVSVNKLKEFNIILPPKSEQEEIAKYLDHKTATIDAIVGNIGKQIDTLKQVRKTLINDVVTGKIKVIE